jgi:hypothetical protein
MKEKKMKKILKKVAFLLTIAAPPAFACPTCIGRLEKNSPPFFSDESNEIKAVAAADENEQQTVTPIENEQSENEG